MLPKPPTDGEKYLYLNQNKGLIYTWGLFSFSFLIIGMILFSKLTIFWAPITALYLFYLGLNYLVGVFGKPWNQSAHQALKHYWLWRGQYPTVDIYLPSCGESLEVLGNTYRYAKDIKWPIDKINFYVLDDANSVNVRTLCARHGFNYILRPNPGELKKAGNIRHAFGQTSGEFILILDADFAPRPDILEELMPYTVDPQCAIVQSPQFFDQGGTWIADGAAYVQELFYRLIQVNRDTWKASICVGTCALYRRKALDPHGGTYPIAYSEDMHTGWQATIDGYYVKYIPLNLAKGLCPESMSAFFIQQTRWCTGSVSLMLSKKFWVNKISPMQRICYLSGMLYYIATALAVPLGILPSIIVVWFFPEKVFWFNALWALPSFLFGVVILNHWSRAKWSFSVLSARQVSYYAHCFALWAKLRGSILEWIPSGNDAQTRKTSEYVRFKTALFLWTSLVTFLAIAGALRNMPSLWAWDFYPILLFASLNYVVSLLCLKNEA